MSEKWALSTTQFKKIMARGFSQNCNFELILSKSQTIFKWSLQERKADRYLLRSLFVIWLRNCFQKSMTGLLQSLVHQCIECCEWLSSNLHLRGKLYKFNKTFVSKGACGEGTLWRAINLVKRTPCENTLAFISFLPLGRCVRRDLKDIATHSYLPVCLPWCQLSGSW